jgi:hypothetical protein
MSNGLMPNGRAPLGAKQVESWRLDQTIESMLEWFWYHAASLFERSTFGAQLARAELESSGTVTCLGCGGNGFADGDDTKPTTCKGCKGAGLVSYELAKKARTGIVLSTDFCPDCDTPSKRKKQRAAHSLAEQRAALLDCLEVHAGNERPAPARAPVCPTCRDDGYIETRAVTRSSSGDDGAGALPPDGSQIERYAVVSRWLSRLARLPRGVEHGRVLERWYGMVGLHWGRGGRDNELEGCDRFWAVIPLTDEGGKMIRRLPNPLGLGPNELLENLVASQKLKRDDVRARRLGIAHEQAYQLYVDACAALKECM